MATPSIGDGSGGFSTSELIQTLTSDLANELGANLRSPARPDGAGAVQNADNASKPSSNQPVYSPPPTRDVSAVLLSEVATSDLTKLTAILEPSSDPGTSRILDSLLRMAVQEVAKGNSERAVGYLADYATRDPRRAETLPFEPALGQVRDKIDSMVGRMTVVAKMSAEDHLSRAEESTTRFAGKLLNWDTSADVLLKLAQRFFEAGGYANYSRTSELARIVNEASTETKPQALAASASASGLQTNPLANQLVPGLNVPYWVSNDVPLERPSEIRATKSNRLGNGTWENLASNLANLKEVSAATISRLWRRAPLLVMMLTWLAVGLAGGVAFSIASRVWPESLVVAIGNFAFDLWGIGFLAFVGFGFYVRIRYGTPHRPSRR